MPSSATTQITAKFLTRDGHELTARYSAGTVEIRADGERVHVHPWEPGVTLRPIPGFYLATVGLDAALQESAALEDLPLVPVELPCSTYGSACGCGCQDLAEVA